MVACQTRGACELPELSFRLWHFCKPAAVSWCWFSAGTWPGSTPSPSCSLFQVCWRLHSLPCLWQESFIFPRITSQEQGAQQPGGSRSHTPGRALPVQEKSTGFLLKVTPESRDTDNPSDQPRWEALQRGRDEGGRPRACS